MLYPIFEQICVFASELFSFFFTIFVSSFMLPKVINRINTQYNMVRKMEATNQKKKYELIDDDFVEVSGIKLFRIRAIRNFEGVCMGSIGGYIRSEESLSHDGNAWVANNAKVGGTARIEDDARVEGNAEVTGNALICENALVRDNAIIYGEGVRLYGNARIEDRVEVGGNAEIGGNARISDRAWVSGHAEVRGHARILDRARIFGQADVIDFAVVSDDARVYGNALVCDNARIYENAEIAGDADIYDCAKVSGKFTLVNGNAKVGGDAIVTKTSDILVIGPVENRDEFLTVTISNEMVTNGYEPSTIDKLEEDARNKNRQDYLDIIPGIRAIVARRKSMTEVA